MTRICIVGGPRTGKTTLATQMSYTEPEIDPNDASVLCSVRHTDDLITTHDWSAASLEASKWLDAPGPWIIEGVALSRALRKWREAHPGEPPPVDKVIRLTTPHVALTKGQTTMAKGEETVWQGIAGWLSSVAIDHQPPTAPQVPRAPSGGETQA